MGINRGLDASHVCGICFLIVFFVFSHDLLYAFCFLG